MEGVGKRVGRSILSIQSQKIPYQGIDYLLDGSLSMSAKLLKSIGQESWQN